jgi:hypothetical protein
MEGDEVEGGRRWCEWAHLESATLLGRDLGGREVGEPVKEPGVGEVERGFAVGERAPGEPSVQQQQREVNQLAERLQQVVRALPARCEPTPGWGSRGSVGRGVWNGAVGTRLTRRRRMRTRIPRGTGGGMRGRRVRRRGAA